MQDMDSVIDRALEMKNVKLVGLHFHIGSQILDMGDFIALCNRVNELQDKLEARRVLVDHINVGGGLGIDYQHPNRQPIPDFKSYFATYAGQLKLRPNQTLHFELGRAVVGQCGSLISKVLYVKQGTNKQFAILDAGMTDLIRPALYQAYHKMENITSEEPVQTYDVVGPICESSDVFGKAIDLNGVKRGDLIALRSAGAYGEIMASGYNCRPLPVGYVSEEFA
jgi:diaminopimelate decarboxylase